MPLQEEPQDFGELSTSSHRDLHLCATLLDLPKERLLQMLTTRHLQLNKSVLPSPPTSSPPPALPISSLLALPWESF